SSFLHWRVAGVRGSRFVAAQLGRAACYCAADWRSFHSPDECGGGCAFARARPALRRLHEAHQAACALRFLRWPETFMGERPAGYRELLFQRSRSPDRKVGDAEPRRNETRFEFELTRKM